VESEAFFVEGFNSAEELISSMNEKSVKLKNVEQKVIKLSKLNIQINEVREILNEICCTVDTTKAVNDRLTISQYLDELIVEYMKELNYIVYQPQIDVVENRIVAFEALLRWNNKKLGFVSPAEFIPIAEKTGIIVEIGDWVLDKVCKKIREFKDKGYKFDNVAINVSSIQIREANFKDKIIKSCEKNDIPLNLLEIEVTESALIELNEEKIADLYELIKKDINISIDDFGTGYSSLSYIKTYLHYCYDCLFYEGRSGKMY